MQDKERIISLLEKIDLAAATDAETSKVQDWVKTSFSREGMELLNAWYEEHPAMPTPDQFNNMDHWEPLLQRVFDLDRVAFSSSPVHRVHFLKTAWFRYAALLLLISGTATFLYLKQEKAPKEIAKNQPIQQPDIQPDGNKAILTLSDGSTIVLDSASNGPVAFQGNTRILKSNGALVYDASTATGKEMYNTISTPKGALYHFTLPDGSKVWLNSVSSITFPAAFIGKERTVTIKGEAYFEIAKNMLQSFTVSAGHTKVQVLGTSFNINAYSDEQSIQATLTQGSVKVIHGSESVVLHPGQQAQAGATVIIQEADVEQVLAWKNGIFQFKGADIQTVMRHLARKYEVKIKYQGIISPRQFTGELRTNMGLMATLRVLERSGIHIRADGQQLTVNP